MKYILYRGGFYKHTTQTTLILGTIICVSYNTTLSVVALIPLDQLCSQNENPFGLSQFRASHSKYQHAYRCSFINFAPSTV